MKRRALHAEDSEGKTLTKLNLMADKVGYIWQKDAYAEGYLPPVDALLEILQWLSRVTIEKVLTYTLRCYLSSLLWTNICSLFPYKKEIVDEWFTLEGKREKALNIKNVSREDLNSYSSYRPLYLSIPLALSDVNYEIFFHATTHDSAQNIIENGIILQKGERYKDFSHGWGFYLGNDFKDALSTRWARNRPPCSAVLVFRVAEAELRDVRNLVGLDLKGNIGEWKNVVQEFRRGPSRRFLKAYQHYDFIEGPLFGEGQSLRNPVPNRDTYQLCIKSTVCAKLFDQNLHSVLFLEPER